MRTVPRLPLLIAALALPIAVVLLGFAFSEGPRTPQVPTEVRVGVAPGPDPPAGPPTATTQPSAELPPPRPDDDDEDDDPDDPHDADD